MPSGPAASCPCLQSCARRTQVHTHTHIDTLHTHTPSHTGSTTTLSSGSDLHSRDAGKETQLRTSPAPGVLLQEG